MVVPHGERAYYELRPQIAIAQPGRGDVPESAVDLDGFFGLHPSMRPLKRLWDEKRLAIVHAVGSPDNTRSHFDAQDYMESATPGVKSTQDGWLNRYVQARPDARATPFRAISMTQSLPRSMQGRAATVAMRNLSDFQIRAGAYTPRVQGGFEGLYEQGVNDVLRGTGRETFEAVNFLKRVNPAQYRPENGAQYPNGEFGRALDADRAAHQGGRRAGGGLHGRAAAGTRTAGRAARAVNSRTCSVSSRRASARSSQTSAPRAWRTWSC